MAIVLLLNRKRIIDMLEECRPKDILVDAVDYLWTLPQELRFALLAAFFLMLFVMSFRILMNKKGGGEQWTK